MQKIVAFSLIGYLEALRHYGFTEPDVNYIFRPMQAVKRMTQLRFDKSIIDGMYRLDEIETLREHADEAIFAKAVDDLLLPLIAFLRETRSPNDGSEAAIAQLIRCSRTPANLWMCPSAMPAKAGIQTRSLVDGSERSDFTEFSPARV